MRRLWLLMVVLVMVFPVQAQEESSSDAPYLYWYSDYLNAFVIERADGTDSRIFGDGLMPEDIDILLGPGWSPSGKWFAWTNRESEEPEDIDSLWILSVDGQRRVTGLEEKADWLYIRWSPVDDLLLVVDRQVQGEIGETGEANRIMRFRILDVETDRILFSFVESFSDEFLREMFPRWSPDGEYITYRNISSHEPENIYHVKVINKNGNLVFQKDFPYPNGGFLSSDWFIYTDPETSLLILRRFATEEIIEINLPTYDTRDILWSPSGEQALIVPGYNEADKTIWLLTLADRQVRPLSEIIPDVTLQGFHSWSPTLEWVLFSTEDEGYAVIHLETLEIRPIPIPEGYEDVPIYTDWAAPHRVTLQITTETEMFGYDYDFMTGIGIRVPLIMPSVSMYGSNYYSKDGRYHAYEATPNVFDTVQNQLVTFQPHSAAHLFTRPQGFDWHWRENWLITSLSVGFDGRGEGAISVNNVDTLISRELGICNYTSLCAGWLPSRVDLSLLPLSQPDSVIPIPDITLEGTAWSRALTWSPDSQFIASHLDKLEYGIRVWQTQIWKINDPTYVQVLEAENEHGVEWVLNEQGYTASVTPVDPEPNIPSEMLDLPLSNNRWLKSFAENEKLMIGIFEDGNLVPTHILEHSDLFSGVTISADFRYLAGISSPNLVHIWDLETGELISILPSYGNTAAFSPDGKWLAVASSWDVELWAIDNLPPVP